MAGIYIHIPFCKQYCSYCDFYRTKELFLKKKLLAGLLLELEYRRQYLENEKIETIYLGGGTPSVLTIDEINGILKKIERCFEISSDVEITIEANPDDLTTEYLRSIRENTLVNRLSIGVQSFIDSDLKLLNRRHDSAQAIKAIEQAEKAGFYNIGVDLIYAIPGMTVKKWESNLDRAFALRINHLSAYHLTIEHNTPIYKMVDSMFLKPVSEEESIAQFKLLIEKSENNHFEHYEISNFAREGYYSKHNSNYWRGKKYLGIGPSAHSYNLVSRQWNISDCEEYMGRIISNGEFFESEFLDDRTKYNEYIMTGLRTMWGIQLQHIDTVFGTQYYEHTLNKALPFITSGKIMRMNDSLVLSYEGKLIADYIIEEIFI
ncbi:MAG: radical SAM family heme chaperone HemW [Bacteroidales bacterium]